MISESHDSLFDDLSPEVAEAVEELTARLFGGEEVDLEAFCQKYPGSSDQLRQLFPTVSVMASMGESSARNGAKQSPNLIESLTGTLGDFRLIREIGRGGMGVVYEAEQLSLGRHVAIKVLPFASLLDPRQLQRFRNESQAAAMLKHPNIVGVHAVGSDRGTHFYAMELVRGRSLAEIITDVKNNSSVSSSSSTNPQTQVNAATQVKSGDTLACSVLSTEQGYGSNAYFRNVARIGRDIAEALQYAHEEGVIHRDIKPSNLLLDDQGNISITDFGLARCHTGHELTMTGELIGTLRYMSPEQAEGQRVLDHRTDIYSLGLVLYELVALQPAFGQKDRSRLLRAIVEGGPPTLRQHVRSVPRDLETVIVQATAKNPEARYSSADELAQDLQRFMACQPVRARRINRFQRFGWWVRRNPLLAGMCLSIALLLIVFAVGGPMIAVRQGRLATDLSSKNYELSITAAYKAWNDGDVELAEKLLAPLMARSDSDLSRRLEAKYLWNRCQAIGQGFTLVHPQPAGPVAYSDDGSTLITGGDDGIVRFWDLKSGTVVDDVRPRPIRRITAIDLSPDGRLLAIAGSAGSVQIWSCDSLSKVRDLRGHAREVRDIEFAPDGQHIASVGMDGRVLLWPVGSEGSLDAVELDSFVESAVSTAFSPDGRYVAATGGADNHPPGPTELRVWNVANGELLRAFDLRTFRSDVLPLAFSADGRLLACGVRKQIMVYDTQLWVQRLTITTDANPIRSLSFSPSDRRIAINEHNRVRLYDVDDSSSEATILTCRANVTSLGWSPNGTTIAASTRDGTVSFGNVPPRGSATNYEGWSTAVAFSHGINSPELLVAHGLVGEFDQGFLTPLNPINGAWGAHLGSGMGYLAVATSDSHPEVVAAAVDNDDKYEIHLLNTRTGRRLLTLSGHEQTIYHMAFSKNGDRLASVDLDVYDKKPSSVRIWDTQNGAGRVIDDSVAAFDVAFWADDQQLAVCGRTESEGFVRSYDVTTRKALQEFNHRDMLICLALSPDERSVFAAGLEGTTASWDLRDGSERFLTQGKSDGVLSAAYTRDGKTIAAVIGDRIIRLWNADTGDRIGDIHTSHFPESLSISDDNQLIAVGCRDGSVTVWGADGTERVFHPSFLAATLKE